MLRPGRQQDDVARTTYVVCWATRGAAPGAPMYQAEPPSVPPAHQKIPSRPSRVAVLALVAAAKRFGDRQALAPTDLAIARGETVALIGPSGCGKTTVLRLLLGLVRPDSGEVHFHGTPIDPGRVRAVRQRMGYVVQDGGLFPHLTAAGNVTLLARHLGWPPARIAVRLEELRTLTRLPGDALDRFPIELSGGQRQRVSLMRALMLDPEVLLLDEPLGAIDPLIRAELQQDLAGIFRQLGKSVVLVTHDLAEAAFFADRLVLMRDGRIVQQGQAAQLVRSPVDPFVTRFVEAQRRFDPAEYEDG